MKTSNRILLGLISAMVFLPILMLVGFRYKIANNDYSVEKYSYYVNPNKAMPLKASRFIRIQSPDTAVMNCTLKYGANDEYQLNSYDASDSLAVESIADTLFFRFIPAPGQQNNHQPEMNFNLSLSAARHIMAGSANLSVDSMGLTDSLQLHLVNHSTINFGSENVEDKPVPYGIVSITADNSEIRLYPRLTMQSLQVKLTGNTTLQIDKEAKIGKVSGTVAPSAVVNGPASYLYQLLFDQD